MSLLFRRLLTSLTLIGSLGCCYWSVRLGWADWLAREGTPEAASKSVELASGNSTYLTYAAITAEDNGGDGTSLRVRAVQVNPLDSQSWIRLAARAEGQNPAEAERDLLRAFAVDRQFEPRWALANFYFRRGERDRTLEWARKSLDFGGGDLNAVFQLCWSASGNGNEILNKAIPARPEVLAQYLQYLDGTARFKEANQVADRLLPVSGPDEAPALTAHCDRSLTGGNVDSAITIWNGLIDHGLLQGERVAPETGKFLVNADFGREAAGIGFDWGMQPVDGVVVERLPGGSGVRLVFSRNEPEHCVILGQYVPLLPQRKYRFRFRYETAGMSGAGTKWVIYDPATKVVLLSAGVNAGSSAGEQMVESEFQTPPESRLTRIELRYEREPGTVRPEGSIRFSHLALEFAP